VTTPAAARHSLTLLASRLLDGRAAPDHWVGRLSSSALSAGTAVLALHLTSQARGPAGDRLEPLVARGARWLVEHQNDDGGWGDTTRSRTNISTTAIVWAALSLLARDGGGVAAAVAKGEAWLNRAAGGVSPDALRRAILQRYGKLRRHE